MGNPNLMLADERKKIIDEIKGSENIARKAREQRKFDIYRKRQDEYVLARLIAEFDAETVKSMRKVFSINPAKRIVDEQASLYVDEPERHFASADDAEVSEEEVKQIKELYKCGNVNPQMRLANRYYKLHSQACVYVLPKDGKIMARALTPKDYDVIPDADDPEKAFAYILNVWDKDAANVPSASGVDPVDWTDKRYEDGKGETDKRNQQIADINDRKAALERYVWWTEEFHFTTNGKGEIVSEAHVDEASGESSPLGPNPIGKLPFVDIANEKDFSFFVQIGSDVTDFVIDFLVQLSDLANTVRFQNYSQAIFASVTQPKGITVGPNKVLWLQIDPNADAGTRPEFSFVSPTPDIMGTLEMLNVQLKMFLSSVGLNPGTVSGKNEMEKFTSGIDHLLSNLDKFKASKEDIDIFYKAEQSVFELFVAWHDVMFDVSEEGKSLDEDLRTTRIAIDKVKVDISYQEPQSVMTQSEIETSCITKLEKKLMTRKEAIKRIYNVDDSRAEEIMAEIDEEQLALKAKGLGPDGLPLPVEVDPETGLPIDPELDHEALPENVDEEDPEVDQKTGKPIGKKPFGKPAPAGNKKPFPAKATGKKPAPAAKGKKPPFGKKPVK